MTATLRIPSSASVYLRVTREQMRSVSDFIDLLILAYLILLGPLILIGAIKWFSDGHWSAKQRAATKSGQGYYTNDAMGMPEFRWRPLTMETNRTEKRK